MIGLLAYRVRLLEGVRGTTAAVAGELRLPARIHRRRDRPEVYAEFCEGCHPGGEEGDGPKIAGEGETPAEMRWRVRSGGDDMPAFGPDKISDADLEALLAFTETFGAVKR